MVCASSVPWASRHPVERRYPRPSECLRCSGAPRRAGGVCVGLPGPTPGVGPAVTGAPPPGTLGLRLRPTRLRQSPPECHPWQHRRRHHHHRQQLGAPFWHACPRGPRQRGARAPPASAWPNAGLGVSHDCIGFGLFASQPRRVWPRRRSRRTSRLGHIVSRVASARRASATSTEGFCCCTATQTSVSFWSGPACAAAARRASAALRAVRA